MTWGKLELYVEHLLPGFLTFVLAAIFFDCPIMGSCASPLIRNLMKNDFIVAGYFISAAYVIGVICALLSRIIIDFVSDWTLTPLFFRAVAWRFLRKNTPKGRTALLRAYDDIFARATVSQNAPHRTNVARARERIHLVRTCFIPISLVFALCLKTWTGLPVWASLLLSFPMGLIVILPLFAYGESLIYQECLRNHELRGNSISIGRRKE